LKFSIVTVCKNNLAGLIKTVSSVLKQQDADFEYIIYDGNSNDGTVEYIKSITDSRLIWRSQNDSGIYDAFNKCIDLASGDYLLFLSSSDVLTYDNTLNKIEEKIHYRIANDEPIVFYGKIVFLDNKKLTAKVSLEMKHNKYEFYKGVAIHHPSWIVPLNLYRKLGHYNKNYISMSDYDYLLRLYNHKIKFEYIDVSLVTKDPPGVSSDFWLCWKEAFSVRRNNNVPSLYNYFFTIRSLIAFLIKR